MKKEAWITAKEAAEIISANSGRPIIQQYVRELAQKGKITSRPVDGRTNEYLRADVEKIKVRVKKVADRQKASSDEKKSMAEEQPWYLPQQEKGIAQIEKNTEPGAA